MQCYNRIIVKQHPSLLTTIYCHSNETKIEELIKYSVLH